MPGGYLRSLFAKGHALRRQNEQSVPPQSHYDGRSAYPSQSAPVQQGRHDTQPQPQVESSHTNPGARNHTSFSSPPPQQYPLQPSLPTSSAYTPILSYYSIPPVCYPSSQSPGLPQQAAPPHCHPVEQNSCSGLDSPGSGGEWYCSASVPDFDACTFCYHAYISNSPFASLFCKVTYPSTSAHSCDMARRCIRAVWGDACASAAAFSSSADQAVWMKHFSNQHALLSGQIRTLSSQIETLREDSAQLQGQHSYHTELAITQVRAAQQQQMMAIRGGAALSLSSFNMSGNGPSYSYSPMNTGMMAPQMGNSAFVAQGIAADISGKQAQLRQVQAQLRGLLYDS